MAVILTGILNGIRPVEGVTEQGPRKGETWQFLSMEISDMVPGHVWSCQLRSDDKQYEEIKNADLKGHKVRVMIASQSASERQLKNGQTVMQIRTQVTNVKDLGIPDDDEM